MVATVGAADGGKITLEEAHRFPTRNGRILGTLQWDLVGIWEDIKEGLRKGTKLVDAAGARLEGIGVDTWGVDFGLLDERGVPMGNPVHYRDGRTDGVMEKVFAAVGRERVFDATGIQFMPFNTLFQLYALKHSEWGGYDRVSRMLWMPDLLHYLLSGKAVSEVTIASTGAVLDPRTRTWNRGLMEELGLPVTWLGELAAPGTKIGGVLSDVARETDAVAGTPVILPGSHDTASAVAAVPVVGEAGGWCYLSSGTWGRRGVEWDAPVVDERTLRLNYTNELGVGGKVRLLKNIMGLWLVQEVRRDLARRGLELDYAELTRLAGEERGLELLLDTWHAPFGSPGGMLGKMDAYARSTAQGVPERPGQYVRACLDSLALSYRLVVENLEALTGKPIATIYIVGGGTKNQLLNQMTADACGRRVVAGPVEATAIGNVLAQAIGAGVIGSLAEGRAMVARSFEVTTYEPRDTSRYERVAAGYRQLCGPAGGGF